MKLTTLDCKMLRVEAGDRILVRIPPGLSHAHIESIRRTVEKWAGSSIPVLIVGPEIGIEVVKGDVSPI